MSPPPKQRDARMLRSIGYGVDTSNSDDEEGVGASEDMNITIECESELALYWKYAANISSESNPLTWWKRKAATFPVIARLARKWLGCVATSVPSERAFSTSGNVATAKRTCCRPMSYTSERHEFLSDLDAACAISIANGDENETDMLWVMFLSVFTSRYLCDRVGSPHRRVEFDALMALPDNDFRQLARVSNSSFAVLHDYIYYNDIFHSADPNTLQSLVASTPAEQVERVNAFDTYEQGLIAHVRGNLQALAAEGKPPHLKPLRLKVTPYEGKGDENLHFWVREVELAMNAALISTEQLRAAFALSNLLRLRAAFLPANYEYRQRSRFLSCKQGKRELHEYIQEMRELTASVVGNPLNEHIKVKVFMDGLRVGPARTQLFWVQSSTLEEAIQVALQEEYSHRQARTLVSVWRGSSSQNPNRASPSAPVPMEIGAAEQHDICCSGSGRLGHFKRDCLAERHHRRVHSKSVLKGRWQKPRPRGQENAGDQ
ncbi:hypothetical protein F444_11233 [Phytophthora nicotianae P1976]|uniref:HAT C-terminal dimerisation domain-containing protein n=1 Tax=Phytophthora nicotianae P1976 TaxID=1317066 RepID=A0A081A1K1_PHYNI|nr:hypothetical protein F444_11233 [Phytophthora nicotianae P1976]